MLDIEIAYSLGLNSGLEEPIAEGKVITEESILTLKNLVQDRLNNLKIEM